MVSVTTSDKEQSGAGIKRMSREELLGIGRGDESWAFVGLAMHALAQEPGDEEIRLLAVKQACCLGLGTFAKELCDGLADSARVLDEIARLDDDRLAIGRLVRGVRAACHNLGERGVDLRSQIDAWRSRVEDESWCLAKDGNVVVRDAQGDWRWVRDSVGNVERLELPLKNVDPEATPEDLERPMYFDGLDGGWLLARVHRCTPVSSCGYQPRLHVIVGNVHELFDTMATGVLVDVCPDARVEWFVGDGAHERFAEWLQQRSEMIVRGPVFGGTRVLSVVEEMYEEQLKESQELRARVDALYADRDEAFWAHRFGEVVAGREKLRVLVLSTTHSTFLQHWGDDLAESWRDAGHEVVVLREPDRYTTLAAPSYLRLMEEFAPDLVMLSNYTRQQLSNVLPENVPLVCWIQDRMGHLFDPELVRTRGRFDYFIGHLYGEVFSQESMRRGSWPTPVLVSSEKFHDGEVPAELRGRFACDVAYVSHQSQCVEELYDEAVRAVVQVPMAQRLMMDVRDDVLALFADTDDERMYRERFLYAANMYRFKGKGKSEAMQRVPVQRLWDVFGARLSERAVRMQTLEWASEICDRRGWSMNLFGNGWESHPTLSRYAAGGVGHGQELRACYQSAGAHLHASAHTVSHQRVFECVLSGGFMLRRLAVEDLHRIEQEIARREAECRGHEWGQDICVPAGANKLFDWYGELRERLGLSIKEEIVIRGKLLDAVRRKPSEPVERDALAVLPGLEATVFRDAQGLERLLESAIGDASLRSEMIGGQREVVREVFTYDAMVKKLPGLILDDVRGTG